MRDDKEFNIKFVVIIEKYPCLYDNTRVDYHLSHVQEQAWAMIAKDIGEQVTIKDCKNRWKNIRGSYTKHLKNHLPSGSGASTKRPYYLSEYLSFVMPFMKSRKAQGNIVTLDTNSPNQVLSNNNENNAETSMTEELEHECEEFLQSTQDANDEDEDVIMDVSEVVSSKDIDISEQNEQLQQNLKKPTDIKKNMMKRKKNNQNNISLEDVNKSAFEYFEKKRQKTTRSEDDADAQFLLSLLPDMKKNDG